MFFSDNGTYFIGARNDLLRIQELLDKRNENSIASHVNRQGFQWLTIPPRSPHYGRLWEAAVESVKRHIKRVIGLQLLYEEFLTVLDRIETILNSRPLYPLSDDPNDPNPITPAHFVIGESLLSIPGESMQLKLNVRYKLIQRLQSDFWKSWKRLITCNYEKKGS